MSNNSRKENGSRLTIMCQRAAGFHSSPGQQVISLMTSPALLEAVISRWSFWFGTKTCNQVARRWRRD